MATGRMDRRVFPEDEDPLLYQEPVVGSLMGQSEARARNTQRRGTLSAATGMDTGDTIEGAVHPGLLAGVEALKGSQFGDFFLSGTLDALKEQQLGNEPSLGDLAWSAAELIDPGMAPALVGMKAGMMLPKKIAKNELKKVGEQTGSNVGAMYEHPELGKAYIKEMPKERVDSEVLANKLYEHGGINVPENINVDLEGQPGIASTFEPGLSKIAPGEKVPGVRENFLIDAWLANWDVVGLHHDNLLKDASGKAIRVDTGGALDFRAQGQPKGNKLGSTVGEHLTMTDPNMNPQAASQFSKITPEEYQYGYERLKYGYDEDSIRELVNMWGPDDDTQNVIMANKLVARREDLLEKLKQYDKPSPGPIPYNTLGGIRSLNPEQIGKLADKEPPALGMDFGLGDPSAKFGAAKEVKPGKMALWKEHAAPLSTMKAQIEPTHLGNKTPGFDNPVMDKFAEDDFDFGEGMEDWQQFNDEVADYIANPHGWSDTESFVGNLQEGWDVSDTNADKLVDALKNEIKANKGKMAPKEAEFGNDTWDAIAEEYNPAVANLVSMYHEGSFSEYELESQLANELDAAAPGHYKADEAQKIIDEWASSDNAVPTPKYKPPKGKWDIDFNEPELQPKKPAGNNIYHPDVKQEIEQTYGQKSYEAIYDYKAGKLTQPEFIEALKNEFAGPYFFQDVDNLGDFLKQYAPDVKPGKKEFDTVNFGPHTGITHIGDIAIGQKGFDDAVTEAFESGFISADEANDAMAKHEDMVNDIAATEWEIEEPMKPPGKSTNPFLEKYGAHSKQEPLLTNEDQKKIDTEKKLFNEGSLTKVQLAKNLTKILGDDTDSLAWVLGEHSPTGDSLDFMTPKEWDQYHDWPPANDSLKLSGKMAEPEYKSSHHYPEEPYPSDYAGKLEELTKEWNEDVATVIGDYNAGLVTYDEMVAGVKKGIDSQLSTADDDDLMSFVNDTIQKYAGTPFGKELPTPKWGKLQQGYDYDSNLDWVNKIKEGDEWTSDIKDAIQNSYEQYAQTVNGPTPEFWSYQLAKKYKLGDEAKDAIQEWAEEASIVKKPAYMDPHEEAAMHVAKTNAQYRTQMEETGYDMGRAAELERAKQQGFDVDTEYFHVTGHPDYVEWGDPHKRGDPDIPVVFINRVKDRAKKASQTGSKREIPTYLSGKTFGKDPLPEWMLPTEVPINRLPKARADIERYTGHPLSQQSEKTQRRLLIEYAAKNLPLPDDVPEKLKPAIRKLREHAMGQMYTLEDANTNFPALVLRENHPDHPIDVNYNVPKWEDVEGAHHADIREAYRWLGLHNISVRDEGDISIMADARYVRSVEAAFNPEKRPGGPNPSRNMLHGVGGVAAPGLMYNRGEDREEYKKGRMEDADERPAYQESKRAQK